MKIYNQDEREMVHQIVNLLSTLDEAFAHIAVQINELRLEESQNLFNETIEALGVVVASSSPLLIDKCGSDISSYISPIRGAIGEMIDAYEIGSLVSVKYMLEQHLMPVFCEWKNKVNLLLIPVIAS